MRLDAHSIKESIQEKIEYKFIVQRYDKDRLDEIVDLMVETLCSKREYITVARDDYPASLVKERLQASTAPTSNMSLNAWIKTPPSSGISRNIC